MPFVSGFLRVRRRKPGGGGPVDPDYGVDEGERPEVGPPDIDNELPEPPPGVWPPLTPDHPWQGLPLPPRPGERPPSPDRPGGTPEHPIELPPGAIWPPLPPDVHGKYLALVLIAGTPGYAYRYVVIDADAMVRPGHPEHPIAPGGTPQPKGR